jgi:DNA-binding transcriptional LysR family regulator
MQWDDLHVFLSVARAGQIARAARVLGVDATTVGRRLRRLEQALGTILFEQTRDGQILTEAGGRLAEQVENMAQIAGGISRRTPAGLEVAGPLRISVSEGFGTWFVANHIGKFAAAYPKVMVDLVASIGFLNPLRGETDVAIMLGQPRRGQLVTRKLANYRLQIYASQHYLAAHAPITRPDQLFGHALIGYIPDIIYAPELRYLDEVWPGLEAQIRSSSINAQHRLAATGAGLAVLPCFIGDADPTLSVVLPEISVTRSFWLVTHPETRKLPRIRRFVEWLLATTEAHKGDLMGAKRAAPVLP